MGRGLPSPCYVAPGHAGTVGESYWLPGCWSGLLSHAPANSSGEVRGVLRVGGGCKELLVGTVETLETGVVCEPASWSCSGSGVAEVVGTVGTLETGVVCEPASCVLVMVDSFRY